MHLALLHFIDVSIFRTEGNTIYIKIHLFNTSGYPHRNIENN